MTTSRDVGGEVAWCRVSVLVKECSSEYSFGDAAEYFAFADALFGGEVVVVVVVVPPGKDKDFFLAERRLKIKHEWDET